MPAKMSSNLSRRSQRKKQTRLAFDPVEPSSSATHSPARIRYQRSSPQPKVFDLISPERQPDGAPIDALPSGRRYAVHVEGSKKEQKNGRIPFEPLLTPVASSQTHAEAAKSTISYESDTSDSDIGLVPTSRRQRTLLSSKCKLPHAANLLSSGGHDTDSLSAITPTFMSGYHNKREMGYDGAEDSSSADLTTETEEQKTSEKPGSKKARSMEAAKERVTTPVENTDEESPLESPIRASVRGGQAVLRKSESEFLKNSSEQKAKVTRSFIAGGNSYSAPVNNKGTSKKTLRSSSKSTPRPAETNKEAVITSSDGEENANGLSSLRQTNRHHAHPKPILTIDESDDALPDLPTLVSSSTRKGKNNVTFAEPLKTDSENNDSEDIITRSSPRRRHPTFVHEDEDEDDEEPILSSPIKRRKTIVQDDSGTDELALPSKRLRVGDKRNAKTNEMEAKRVTRKQQQKKLHRSEREKKLELLKRQRAGEKIIALTSSESDEEPVQALYDSNSELEVLSDFEDEEENDEIHRVRESLRPLNRNNNDDDFIVDDDDDPLGVPDYGLHDIPLQFTHQAHKRPIEHFKDAIEWLVQNKLNPGFNRNDPIYTQAFRKVDVEVRGYADSKYTSASWKAPFTRALSARPEFFVEALGPGDMIQGRKCGACGRTNHPASYQIQFGGKAYNKETLEEIDNDHGEDDDDEDDEDDNASVNSRGESIPDVKTSWYVGRTCKGNAETAHRLKHWKHALNEWVIGTLKSEGHLTPRKLAQREDWNKKKRSEYANEIVDSWSENKEIKALYRDFKNNLEAAREGKTGRWRN